MLKSISILIYFVSLSSALFCQNNYDEQWSPQAKALLAQAKDGISVSQLLLGELLLTGSVTQNVKKDATAASVWLKMASDKNLPKAQVLLGQMLLTGDGVPRDETEAVRLFQIAAESGNARGQFALGSAYDNGTGVETNQTKAIQLYRLAAEAGNKDAQFALAQCYKDGRLVKANSSESQKWLELAAAQGHENAQNLLQIQRNEAKRLEQQRISAARLQLYSIGDEIINMAATKQLINHNRARGRWVNEAEVKRLRNKYESFRLEKMKVSGEWKIDGYKDFLIKEAKLKFVDPGNTGRPGWYFSYPDDMPISMRKLVASQVLDIAIKEIKNRW